MTTKYIVCGVLIYLGVACLFLLLFGNNRRDEEMETGKKSENETTPEIKPNETAGKKLR